MNRIILEIKGGNIVAIHSEEDLSITIIDHDLIESEGDVILQNLGPDVIRNFEESLDNIMKEDNLQLLNYDGQTFIIR